MSRRVGTGRGGRVSKPRTRLGNTRVLNRESLNVVLDENVPSPSYNVPSPSYVQPMMYQPQIPVSHLTPQYHYPLQQIPHSQHTHQMQQAIQISHSQHTHQIQPNYQTVPQTSRQPFREIGNVSQVENSSLDVDEDNVFTMNMNLMPFFKELHGEIFVK